ncbi:PLD nuclease N-terminal domain-containing protein [Myceligenerans salitolerans]|uniref:PLDc_N domain-containing protein n=1 Tax=Myceligenerans salitolerans TaxID=1230528 RepID=A0ABS3I733_9MICO|nr:PLD nuclease N-terminal domain-containing protein [Myceligenerans salitolerans]MBO0608797.1 PLDc_N domain-containing protein [Myceligenerans salitolerans]
MRPLLLGVLYVALVVYTLVDVAQSDDEERHGIPKALWVGAIILLPLIGSIAWIVLAFLARRRKGRRAAAPWERVSGDTAAPPPADEVPAGPEDDPEYMWLLEQARRRREREERRRAEERHDDSDDGSRPDRPQDSSD